MRYISLFLRTFRFLTLLVLCLGLYSNSYAQKLGYITKFGVEIGKQMKIYNGQLYYSTAEDKMFKLWACDVLTKKSKLVMKSKENIGHFFEVGKTLLFTLDKGHPGEDGILYYLDEHGKPIEVVMKEEAGPDVNPDHGRHIEIVPFRKGFLILAPVRDMVAKYKLYRYNLKQDSAKPFFPKEYFVMPGLVVSPDQKIIIAGLDIVPPHPWENTKEFWNKYSQLFIIHNDDNGKPFEKWLDRAELHDANFKYTNRTWINLSYKDLKDNGVNVDKHTIFVVTNPSEKKGSMPKHIGDAADSSLFLFQKRICYYFPNKGNMYLVTAFEYPTFYKLKYGKLSGHNLDDFVGIYGNYSCNDVLFIITAHKKDKPYYNGWALKYKFDTAEWLEAHTFMNPVQFAAKLTATLPVGSVLKTFTDTDGNIVYLKDKGIPSENKMYKLTQKGAVPFLPNGHEISSLVQICAFWQGNMLAVQKGTGDTPDQLVLNSKTGIGYVCSPGDKYQPDFNFFSNGHLFFGDFTARTTKLVNWQTDGTVEGTHRLDISLVLQLDFSQPYITGNKIFLPGHDAEKVGSKDQLFVLEF